MKAYYKLFGLTKHEERVLDATFTPKLVATIAIDAKVPRTSVDSIVQRLTSRGLLRKIRRSKRCYYQKISREQIVKNFLPNQTTLMEEYTFPLFEGSKIVVHFGDENLLKIYENVYTTHAHRRVYGIQPTKSALNIFKKVSQEQIDQINSFISQNKVVQESIIEDDYFEEIKKLCKFNFRKWLSGLVDRVSITHMVDRNEISFDSELVLYGETVVILNWGKSIAIEIVHAEIVQMFNDLFHSFQKQGKRVELREITKRLL